MDAPSATVRRLVTLCAVASVLAACGPNTGAGSPALSTVPLAPHSHVALRIRACNKGADAFCALELVLVGHGYTTSNALLDSEASLLARLHWRQAHADTGLERAANSPGGGLRLTYATARGELQSIGLGWSKRAPALAVALAHTMFDNVPALALLVEVGSG